MHVVLLSMITKASALKQWCILLHVMGPKKNTGMLLQVMGENCSESHVIMSGQVRRCEKATKTARGARSTGYGCK